MLRACECGLSVPVSSGYLAENIIFYYVYEYGQTHPQIVKFLYGNLLRAVGVDRPGGDNHRPDSAGNSRCVGCGQDALANEVAEYSSEDGADNAADLVNGHGSFLSGFTRFDSVVRR